MNDKDNFITDRVDLIRVIEYINLLDKCKCDICQKRIKEIKEEYGIQD